MQESFLSKFASSMPMALAATFVAVAGLALWVGPKITQNEQRISELERELIDANSSLSSISNQLATLNNETQRFRYLVVSGDITVEKNRWSGDDFKSQLAAGNGAPISCPNGQFVKAIRLVDRDQGKFCVECITNLEIYCSEL